MDGTSASQRLKALSLFFCSSPPLSPDIQLITRRILTVRTFKRLSTSWDKTWGKRF